MYNTDGSKCQNKQQEAQYGLYKRLLKQGVV